MGDLAPAYVIFGVGVVAQAIISWANQRHTQDRVDDHEERIRVLEKFQAGEEAVDKLKRGQP